MKKHQVIFGMIKELLKKHIGNDLIEHEGGTNLILGDSGVTISCDDNELMVGYGLVHTHFYPEFDDLQVTIDSFFKLLIRRKRITLFYKGSFCFKHRIELMLDNSEIETIGTSATWFFPYWRRTRKEVKYEDPLIDPAMIDREINDIKNHAIA